MLIRRFTRHPTVQTDYMPSFHGNNYRLPLPTVQTNYTYMPSFCGNNYTDGTQLPIFPPNYMPSFRHNNYTVGLPIQTRQNYISSFRHNNYTVGLPTQTVVPTGQSNYMPSFYGNCSNDPMAAGEPFWQQKNPGIKTEDYRSDQTTLRVAQPESQVLFGPDGKLGRWTLFPVDEPKF